MLTYVDAPLSVDDGAERDDRAGHRPYRVEVAAIRRMTPHFTRITFRGDELGEFGTDRQDQRLKLLLPPESGAGYPDLGLDDTVALQTGAWWPRLRALPLDERPPLRTYTVRDVRPGTGAGAGSRPGELDVDFVDHGEIGPAGRWLAGATVGDEVVIVGATSRSRHSALGIDWHPGPARRVLLVGDETAAPAICSIVESLPDLIRARAFIEVPRADDALELDRRDGDITWLVRGERDHGAGLQEAVRGWVGQHRDTILPAVAPGQEQPADVDIDRELLWDSPMTASLDFYAWVAGEASVVKSIRRFLVTETGIDRRQVAFMGYWRAGRSEVQE